MRRALTVILAFAMALSFAVMDSPSAFAAQTVKVNGSTVAFDQPPVIISNRTLVPLRAIFEALGAQVNWNDATKTVIATRGDTTITAIISSSQAIVSGALKTLDVPAQIINSRTLVPVRFISESLGAKVDWDEASQTVIITDGQSENVANYDIEKYFPLNVGNYRFYRNDAGSPGILTETVLFREGNLVQVQKQSNPPGNYTIYKIYPDRIEECYYGEATNESKNILNDFQPNESWIVLKGPIEVGTNWTNAWNKTANQTSTIVSLHEAAVCGGTTYSNCIKVSNSRNGEFIYNEYYAPGVGFVKRESNNRFKYELQKTNYSNK